MIINKCIFLYRYFYLYRIVCETYLLFRYLPIRNIWFWVPLKDRWPLLEVRFDLMFRIFPYGRSLFWCSVTLPCSQWDIIVFHNWVCGGVLHSTTGRIWPVSCGGVLPHAARSWLAALPSCGVHASSGYVLLPVCALNGPLPPRFHHWWVQRSMWDLPVHTWLGLAAFLVENVRCILGQTHYGHFRGLGTHVPDANAEVGSRLKRTWNCTRTNDWGLT